jgi:hypothetical protein
MSLMQPLLDRWFAFYYFAAPLLWFWRRLGGCQRGWVDGVLSSVRVGRFAGHL